MADTDVANALGWGIVQATAILQFRKSAVAPQIITMAGSTPGNLTVRIPVYAKAALANTQSDGAEGTAGSSVAISIAAKDCKPLRNNIWAEVTDLSAHGNTNLNVNAGRVLGNSVAAELDDQVADLCDDFATVVGSSTAHNDVGVLFDAVANLEANDAPRPYGSMLHPLQVFGNHGITESNADALQNTRAQTEFIDGAGFAGSIGGVNIFTSGLINITSDQHKGAVMAKTAIGCGFLDFGGGNFIQIETARNASKAVTEVVANGYFACIETVDLHGVTVHTETS